ncbi:MAG: FhaA domain-containing protein [Mycobacteriales bacterium]|nr:DUF3662 and FHA domain-containing protein [Frankia sp.]
MGVLQRFERRLEGAVEGAFAKVFRGGVQPVEIAKALQREADDHRMVSPNRVLVPNDYVVELGPSDYERLSPYAEPLGAELAAMVREHAGRERLSFVGPVTVSLEQHDDIDTGVFRVRSGVASGDVEEVPTPSGGRGRPRLVVLSTPAGDERREVDLTSDVVVIGRGADTDLRLADTGTSRRHAEIRREGDDVFLVDLGSTNGTLVNGRAVERTRLMSGDEITVGQSRLVYQRDDE